MNCCWAFAVAHLPANSRLDTLILLPFMMRAVNSHDGPPSVIQSALGFSSPVSGTIRPIQIRLYRRNFTMNSETDKPKNVLADLKKIESWASITRGLTGLWAIGLVGALALHVFGIIEKEFLLGPMFSLLFTFFLALPLGLVAMSKKAIENLQERVSELEKRLPQSPGSTQ
jgi:hypothetical protein